MISTSSPALTFSNALDLAKEVPSTLRGHVQGWPRAEQKQTERTESITLQRGSYLGGGVNFHLLYASRCFPTLPH